MSADAYQLRWLVVSETLRWHTSMRLPLNPLDGALAIAPNRRRIAFVDVGMTGVHVYDADLMPVAVVGTSAPIDAGHRHLGFIDDTTLGIAGSSVVWWTPTAMGPARLGRDPWAVTAPDPWAVTPQRPLPTFTPSAEAVFVDGHMIAPSNLALALTDPKRTRYLGWKDTAVNTVAANVDYVAIGSTGMHFTWLDESLAVTHKLDLRDNRTPDSPYMYGTLIGDHHVLSQTHVGRRITITLVDAKQPTKPINVGTFDTVDRYEYFEGMIAVVVGGQVHRYRADLTTNTVTKLEPSLRVGAYSASWIRLFDPERAGGMVAAVQGWASDYAEHQTLTIYRQSGKRITKSKIKRFEHQLLRTDATGRMFVRDYTNGSSVLVMRGKEIERRIPLPPTIGMPIAINKLGTQLAVIEEHHVVVLDAAGTEQWRKPLWGASSMTFVGDGKRLVVGAPGGFVAFDTATGEERAKECAWNFGLHETVPEATAMGFGSVCEDPIVQ